MLADPSTQPKRSSTAVIRDKDARDLPDPIMNRQLSETKRHPERKPDVDTSEHKSNVGPAEARMVVPVVAANAPVLVERRPVVARAAFA